MMDIGFQPHSPVSAPEWVTGGAEHPWPLCLVWALPTPALPLPHPQCGSVAPLSLAQVSLFHPELQTPGAEDLTPRPGFQEQSVPRVVCLSKGRGGSERTCSRGSRAPAPSRAGSTQPVQGRQCSRLNKESTSAHSSRKGHSRESCTCTGSTDRDEPAYGQTLHVYRRS